MFDLFKKKPKCLCAQKDESIEHLNKIIKDLRDHIEIAEKETVYWKKIALNFRKYHQ